MKNHDLHVKAEDLLDKVKKLREHIYKDGNKLFQKWKPKINNEDFLSSAENLSYYLALRSVDITDLQNELSLFGLSSLGRLESRTLETIDAVICSLENIISETLNFECYPSKDDFLTGKDKLEKNAETLFGKFPKNRKNMILVTMHNDLSYDEIEDFMKRGMNLARINCAKENTEIWDSIISNIRKAEKKLKKSCKVITDIAGPKVRIKWIMSSLEDNRVNQGHKVFISKVDDANFDSNYDLQVGCTLPEVLDKVKKGDLILLDDGSIEGKVTDTKENGIVFTVDKVVKDKGVKVKLFKGINFPDSNLELDILTNKDKNDLDYVIENADVACISFVNTSEDIDYTISEIKKRLKDKKENHPVIAKIETTEAIKNLPEIIVAGAGNTNFGIMIARGDLAVELGYLKFAEIQQEILWICEAADIPVIWATQVLESMAKTGIPSRAEVTDAAEGGAKAECVMLNKGSHIADVITFLDELLENMKENNYKKTAKLRVLSIAKNYFK